MISLLFLCCSFLACLTVCELFLGSRKLQTALTAVSVVHASFAVLTTTALHFLFAISPVAILIFWVGAFLAWFGIRSHIESSILVRMIYLLKIQPATAEQLLKEYQAHYSSSVRLRELERARLIVWGTGGIQLTKKGLFVARVARMLGGMKEEA